MASPPPGGADLPAVSIPIEDNRVKVYAPLFAIAEHETSGAVIETDPIAQRSEQSDSRICLIQLNDGVKVVMRPGLPAD